ncbi:TlpA disulfide reductase family protein [Pelagimonas varians]|uniref:Thiol:disulfide interchange protein TlpA n=1 Tax=Pelagimonas varians TaxID=696760 RepID=A0A238KJ09_9RHOB|nr:TlpA disulfide reductase family protein [Pelagimonas varians]PYG29562.1 thiol-disulfide isomerase/thioredoxin [Pelagimonas varians]SMX42795.1 Thiol:disulfide interchange protein TlpA [Pelagimonas varians]
MKKLGLALLYTATMALANPGFADVAAATAAREGGMKKLILHSEPKTRDMADFMTFEGEPLNLSDWHGKWIVVNFWATWCAPCRKEMPMLADLQADMGSDTFEVLTIATSRNPPPAMKSFFEDIGVTNLPLHRDPKSLLARGIGVLGLPATVIFDPDGNEVGRMTGDADWSSDSAKAVLNALMGAEG